MTVFMILLVSTCSVQTSAFPGHFPDAIDKVWAMMNEKWTRYPKLGLCRNNARILERFNGRDFCQKRQ